MSPSLETKVLVARSKLCGSAIIEVRDYDEALLAKFAGARCVLVATPSPSGGRCTSYSNLIMKIMNCLSPISVMARVRIGHTPEADALESIGCQFIDESELLSVADEKNFLNKHELGIPCVCGCQNLGEALRRVGEGAVMIRIQGETSRTGHIAKTVNNLRSVMRDVESLRDMNGCALRHFSARIDAPFDLLVETKRLGRLPVPTFAAGGISTADDALLLMQLGCDGVFVGSEIFDTEYPLKEIENIIGVLDSRRDGGLGETNQSTAEKGSTADQGV
ncbi:pyridoxal 5'-phosphate synthase-like subunit PDX1.2 [Syzygium oleosum]|uniref:pyridoxal 5'-phosphate synthase-like subunit PDX1.2 n=1 Tax=Syzygium oleosum TaxID=219896 RepID=UPI0024BABE6B|nr:pyridoxal 5'-phosphate synthase-like subunit PDX1.2 [Syzygium oleosum]